MRYPGLNYLNIEDTKSTSKGNPDPNSIRDELALTFLTSRFARLPRDGNGCASLVFLCSFLVTLFAKRYLLSLEVPAGTESSKQRSLSDAAEEERLLL